MRLNAVLLIAIVLVVSIPAIAIDPKGDLGNLLLAFPQLRASDFRPWIDESVAAAQGVSAEQFAEQTAQSWKSGLAQWGQDGARIQRFNDAVDKAIYSLDAKTGGLRWRFQTDGAVTSSAPVVDSVVYIGSSDHSVYALPA